MTAKAIRLGALAPWVGAAGIAFSALFYLLDFASTLSTLHASYLYAYRCPHVPLSSPLPRHDALCRAVRLGPRLHNYGVLFWLGVAHILLGHLSASFIFWITLPTSQHSLRLAYVFLPLLHFYRLFKLLLYSFSSSRISEFVKSQTEASGLYDALGVAMETIPRFIMQFAIALNLGRRYSTAPGSSNPNNQLQGIPKVLLISLITSIMSGTYNAAIAMFYNLGNRMPLFHKFVASILFGIHVFAMFLAKGGGDAPFLLYQSPTGLSNSGVVIVAGQFIISWIFCCFVVRIHGHTCKRKRAWLEFVHSIALAFMMRLIGPIYILTKLNTSLCLFFWGAILHLIGLMIGPIFVFFWPLGIKSPCRALGSVKGIEGQENKYLTCSLYMGMTIGASFMFILTTFFLIWVHIQAAKKVSKLPVRDLSRITGINLLERIAPNLVVGKDFRTSLHEMCICTLFDHFVILLTTLSIQMLAKPTKQKLTPYMHGSYGSHKQCAQRLPL